MFKSFLINYVIMGKLIKKKKMRQIIVKSTIKSRSNIVKVQLRVHWGTLFSKYTLKLISTWIQ